MVDSQASYNGSLHKPHVGFPLCHADGHMLYMGKDKYENEDLIRYGVPEDVWFHVDNLSSAHVYLRMNRGEKVRSKRDEEHGAHPSVCRDRHGAVFSVDHCNMIPSTSVNCVPCNTLFTPFES